MSGNQMNGVHAIFGANNQDTRLQDTYHSGRVNFGNGGIACANDSMGCHFDIGTKGGFYDNEDGWISFQNNSPTLGLKNSKTTDVLGATLDNDILTRDGVSYSFSAGGAPGQGQDAALTYGGGWINATGGSGFQGVSAYLMQAQRFQDRNDNSYYFIPSQFSRLNELQLAGKITTNGYDLNAGFNQGVPALGNVPSLMAGGLVTNDVYAEGGLYNGNSDGHAQDALMANGNGYLSGLLKVNQNIHAQGTVSTDGLDASNPQAWDSLSNSGGIHTSALKSDGGSIFTGSNYSGYAGSGLLNQSKLEMSGIAKASVFRTMGFHPIQNTSCDNNVQSHNPYTNQVIGVTLGGQVKDNTSATYQYGDIAADPYGKPLSCVNGIWKPIGNALFSTFNGCNTASQWVNTSGQPEFVSAYSNTVNNDSDTLSMTLIAPGGQTYLVSSTDDPSDGGIKRYSVDGFVPNGWTAHIDSTIGVAGVCHWGGDVPGTNNPTVLPDIPNAPDPIPPTPPTPPGLPWVSSGIHWEALYAYMPGDGFDPLPFYDMQLWAIKADGSRFSVEFQCLISGDHGESFIQGYYDTSSPAGSAAQCSAFADAIYALSGLSSPYYGAPFSTAVNNFTWSSLIQSDGQGGNSFYPIALYGTSDYGGQFGRPSNSYFYGGQDIAPRNDSPTGDLAARIANDYRIIANGGLN